MTLSKHLTVTGVVQGVGFRPFVYNLASAHMLSGYVLNTDDGVEIYIEGEAQIIELFEKALTAEAPAASIIDSITTKLATPMGFKAFEIRQSESKKVKSSFLPNDIAICDECKGEIRDTKNRRYGYALCNCTNCGPRYTIISALPYDRANTSMSAFEMCGECKREYEDPSDRRFHAEPISCPKCGPKLIFCDKDGNAVESDDTVNQCARELKSGKIVAIKGLGGFHLACDASDSDAIARLRERKKRAKKPLAVMFEAQNEIRVHCKISKKESELLSSTNAPIVLLQKKDGYKLPHNLSFDSAFLGTFLPYTPLQVLLFEHLDIPLVMTSANISDEPIITELDELLSKLGSVVDFVLDFDRAIVNGCDDSVVRCFGSDVIYLRLARGYAPMNSTLKNISSKNILALGAQQKATISLGVQNSIITSAYIADLFGVSGIEKYQKTIANLSALYDFRPEVVVCDKNSAYESSKIAHEMECEVIELQHHKAHFYAGLFEANLLDSSALGVIFDGTGMGDEGKVWGGEFFVYEKGAMRRVCHLREFLLLGGEMAAKHPQRSALSILFDIYGEEVFHMKNPTTGSFLPHEISALYKMHKNSANSIMSSSAGRLFDAVASYLGLVQKESYDGESGLLIESLYDGFITSRYDVKISEDIDMSSIFRANDTPVVGASKFLNALSFAIGEVASGYSLPVVLSGGVFQNATLCALVSKELKSRQLKVHFHKKLSPNDSSVSVGQAIFANLLQNKNKYS